MAARAKNSKTFKQFLLLNQKMDCSNDLAMLNKMAARAIIKKTFKRLRLLNQCIDFEIIIQECSLSDSLPKLLKPFRSIEQDGRQS